MDGPATRGTGVPRTLWREGQTSSQMMQVDEREWGSKRRYPHPLLSTLLRMSLCLSLQYELCIGDRSVLLQGRPAE